MEEPLSTYLSLPVSLPLLHSAISMVHNRSLDYSLFTSPEARKLIQDTNRIVGITLSESKNLFSSLNSNSSNSFCIQLTCTNFLYQMVRRLTTALIQVAQGQISLEEFERRLSPSKEYLSSYNDNDQLLNLNGLYLQNVLYDEQDFQRYVTYTVLTTKKHAIYPLAPVLTGEE